MTSILPCLSRGPIVSIFKYRSIPTLLSNFPCRQHHPRVTQPAIPAISGRNNSVGFRFDRLLEMDHQQCQIRGGDATDPARLAKIGGSNTAELFASLVCLLYTSDAADE